MWKASEKQINKIVHLVCSDEESQTIRQIYSELPTNNATYPDERANYKKAIMEDKLKGISLSQASWIIDSLISHRNLDKIVKTFKELKII